MTLTELLALLPGHRADVACTPRQAGAGGDFSPGLGLWASLMPFVARRRCG